jgi:hypothetical protein
MRRPVNSPYTITTEFGVPDSYAKFGYHSGVDYAVPLNRPIYAPTSGQLTNVVSPTGGNMVVIKDNQGLTHRLMHNNSFSRSNGWVNEGEQVALAGTTGLSTGVHSHWDINKEGTYPTSFSSFISPADWLAGKYNVTAPSAGGTMTEKVDISTARILAETILGRDRDYTHAGKGDADLIKNHVGQNLTNQYIFNLWNSPEAKAYAAQKAKDKVALATQTKRADVAEKTLAEANKEIDRLKAQLAVQSDDTQLLNGFGEALRKLIVRLGLKG